MFDPISDRSFAWVPEDMVEIEEGDAVFGDPEKMARFVGIFHGARWGGRLLVQTFGECILDKAVLVKPEHVKDCVRMEGGRHVRPDNGV